MIPIQSWTLQASKTCYTVTHSTLFLRLYLLHIWQSKLFLGQQIEHRRACWDYRKNVSTRKTGGQPLVRLEHWEYFIQLYIINLHQLLSAQKLNWQACKYPHINIVHYTISCYVCTVPKASLHPCLLSPSDCNVQVHCCKWLVLDSKCEHIPSSNPSSSYLRAPMSLEEKIVKKTRCWWCFNPKNWSKKNNNCI